MIGYYTNSNRYNSGYAQILASSAPDLYKIYTSAVRNYEYPGSVVRIPEEHVMEDTPTGTLFNDPAYLKCAPMGVKDITRRNRYMLESFDDDEIRLLIVDDSVEVAALARVSSVPYAYVKRFGIRNDTPHHSAYDGAAFLMAYYPEELEPHTTPLWIRQKTIYTGFFSQYSCLADANRAKDEASVLRFRYRNERFIAVLPDSGGRAFPKEKVMPLTESFPDSVILVSGATDSDEYHERVKLTGRIDDPGAYLAVAQYVMGACTLEAVSQALCFPAEFIPIETPEDDREANGLKKALLRNRMAHDPARVFNGGPYLPPTNGQSRRKSTEPKAGEIFNKWLRERRFDFVKLREDIRRHQSLTRLNKNLNLISV